MSGVRVRPVRLMFFRFAIPLTLLLGVYADVPDVPHLTAPRSEGSATWGGLRPEDRVPLYPTVVGDSQDHGKSTSDPKRGDTLQESSKLSLIRYVSGEFAKA
jgi:hypothetical protein